MSSINTTPNNFHVVYFSSQTENTHRFVLKLNCHHTRIPLRWNETNPLLVNHPYTLIVPTYAGGLGLTKNAVPKQVIKFLNLAQNRTLCQAVIACGNRNFSDTYCLAGQIISAKLQVPWLYSLELSGTADDVNNVIQLLQNLGNSAKSVRVVA